MIGHGSFFQLQVGTIRLISYDVLQWLGISSGLFGVEWVSGEIMDEPG